MKILICLIFGLIVCCCTSNCGGNMNEEIINNADVEYFQVTQGRLSYYIDSLNRICTVGRAYVMQYIQSLPQPMCDRLIERYTKNK